MSYPSCDGPAERESPRRQKIVFFSFFLIITIIYLYPFSNYRFATTDDFFCYILSNQSMSARLELHDVIAKQQGRIHFYAAFFAQEFGYAIDDFHLIRLSSNAFKVINLLLFAYLVYLHTRSIHYFVFAYIVPLIFLQDGSGFNVISGYTFSYQLYFIFYITIFIFINRLLSRHSNAIYALMVLMCALFLTMSEASIPMFLPIILYLFFQRTKTSTKLFALYTAPLLALPTAVFFIWFYFKNIVATATYAGIVPSFDITKSIKTLLHFSFAHFSCRSFLSDNSFVSSGFTPYFRTWDRISLCGYSLEPLLNPFLIITSAIVAILLTKCSTNMKNRASTKSLIYVLCFGMLTILIPNVLTGISLRYQQLQSQGFPATPYSYFSIFGFAIVFIAIISYANTNFKKNTKKIITFLLCGIFFITSSTSLATNYSFGTLRYIDNIKWDLADSFIQSKNFKQITNESILYTINLYDQTMVKRTKSKPTSPFWSKYFSLKSGVKDIHINTFKDDEKEKKVQFFFDIKQNTLDVSETSFYIFSNDSYYVKNDDNQKSIYANIVVIGLHSKAKYVAIKYNTKKGACKTLKKWFSIGSTFIEFKIADDDQIDMNSIDIRAIT